MAEALHHLTYDATIDDAVDVSLRMAQRTRAFRRQIRLTTILVGAVTGVAAILAWMLWPGWAGRFSATAAILFAAVFGVVVALVFRPMFAREIRRQHRRVIAEHFGGASTIPSELEVRPDAIWVRQAGIEMVFPWSQCTRVDDRGADIELHFGPGMCVVRNRYFAPGADRATFLDTVRRLAGTAASSAGGPTPR